MKTSWHLLAERRETVTLVRKYNKYYFNSMSISANLNVRDAPSKRAIRKVVTKFLEIKSVGDIRRQGIPRSERSVNIQRIMKRIGEASEMSTQRRSAQGDFKTRPPNASIQNLVSARA